MSSTNPHSENTSDRSELERLVRRALKAQVGGQKPPERVWKRIKLELERDKSPLRRFQMRWSPVAVQAVLTLLVIMLGGIGLRTLSNPDDVRHSSHTPLASVTAVYVEERSDPPALAMLQDKDELRSLKALSKPGTGGPADQPPVVVPGDVTSNVLNPEGPALTAGLPRPPGVEKRDHLHSGPYQWFR